MRQHFRPEFLNRVDEIILFKPLQLDEIRKIVDLLVEQLGHRLADRQLKLELTDTASTYIVNRGYDPVFGARPLKRFLQRELETRIGRKLIAGEIQDGQTILVDVVDGALTVEQVKHAETGSEG